MRWALVAAAAVLASAECEAEQSRVRFAVQVLPDGDSGHVAFGRQEARLEHPRCVPRICVESNFHGRGCKEIVSQNLEDLQSQVLQSLDSNLLDPPWMTGESMNLPDIGPSWSDHQMYLALRAPPAQPSETPRETGAVRVFVVGTHGPLSSLMGNYLKRASEMVRLQLELVFFGQCHLCQQFEPCRSRRVASAADLACGWRPGAELSEQMVAAAEDILLHLDPFSPMVCIGFFLCHFVLDALVDTIPCVQVLSMNPLHDTTMHAPLPLLRSLEKRLLRGDPIFARDAVTAALTAYHLNIHQASAPPAVAFLNLPLRATAQRLPRGDIGRPLLFSAVQHVMGHIAVEKLEELLGRLWEPGVERMPSKYNLEDAAEVSWMLSHSAVVHIPQHPAQLAFQDFYSMALPIFLPCLSILAWLWPRVQVAGQTYDGWFDRHILPARIARPGSSHRVEVPEPFNLDIDGEVKVEHWLRLSDFFHYPGVQVFHGLASIIAKLTTENLDAARVAMQKHFKVQSSIALSIFRSIVAAGTGSTKTGSSRGRRTRGDRPVHDVPFVSCMAQSLTWSVSSKGYITAWRLRFGHGVRRPFGPLRLQVWRPVAVGWQKGLSYSFRLVGEHLTKGRARRTGSKTWKLRVPKARRFLVRPGDRLAFAFQPQQNWWRLARSRSTFTPVLPRGVQVPPLCFGLGKSQEPCQDWPQRKVCGFQEQQWLPSEVLTLEAETEAPEVTEATSLTLAFELPGSSKYAGFAVEILQLTQSQDPKVAPDKLTFFLCPEEDSLTDDAATSWKKVFQTFDASVGVSTRCAEELGLTELDAIDWAKRLFQALLPLGPWVILSSDTERSFQLARELAETNPVGQGLALRSRFIEHLKPRDGNGPCSMKLPMETEQQVCFVHFGLNQIDGVDQELIAFATSSMGPSWSMMIFKFPAVEWSEGPITEALETLFNRHMSQLLEAASIGGAMKNLFEVLRLDRLWSAVNLSEHIDQSTTYEDFMTLRRSLGSLELSLFEDKIQLRRWLQSIGVEHTPSIYLSDEDPHILPHLEGHGTFVVKPSHMTESEHVVVVRDGRYVFDVFSQGKLQGLQGQLVDKEALQWMILNAWNESAFAWECQAVLAARPGVIVEHLITARLDTTSQKRRVEEARVHVVWGRMMALEWAVNRIGSLVYFSNVDSMGRWGLTCDNIWATNLGDGWIEDPDTWVATVKNICIPKVIAVAERVASAAQVDHLRVDLLVKDVCESVYVSEVELFPAVPFGLQTKTHIERRWRQGYGFGAVGASHRR